MTGVVEGRFCRSRCAMLAIGVAALYLACLLEACQSCEPDPTPPDAGPDACIGVADCGVEACLIGEVGDAGACRPVKRCIELDCAAQGRVCLESQAHSDAMCGGCASGASGVSGSCQRVSCTDLGCSAQHRTCVESPSPHCIDTCIEGYLWDAARKLCRTPIRCADLECTSAQTCLESNGSQDAVCRESACQQGMGWDVLGHQCRACYRGFSPNCTAEHLTGAVWVAESKDNAECICETEHGYYLGESKAAAPCDADGDGWVSDSAQPSLESANPILRANAHCSVRRIAKVMLENEQGESFEAEDFAAAFGASLEGALPAGLPLYESARNDGAPSAAPLPMYPGRGFKPQEVNSLTKACSPDEGADLNDNGVSDVDEHSASEVTLDKGRGASTALNAYYAKYARFGFFTELHTGWFEEDSADRGAQYWIRERSRVDLSGQGVPVRYSGNLALDGGVSPSYAQRCARHIDTLYQWEDAKDSTIPAHLKTPASSTGGDFSEFGDLGWVGMTHHSQYKCVKVVSQSKYGTYNAGKSASEQENPTLAVPSVSGVGSLRLGQSVLAANDCRLSDSPAGIAPGPGPNPRFPSFACKPTLATPAEDAVVLASVQYENGAQKKGNAYKDYSQRGDYRRGCINECVDVARLASPSWPICQQCRVNVDQFGQGALENKPVAATPCDERNPSGSGMCNGAGRCGTCAPGGPFSCRGIIRQSCTSEGQWKDDGIAVGSCGVACIPGAQNCRDVVNHQTCNANGQWQEDGVVIGKCTAVCLPGEAQVCNACASHTCDASGHWGACPDLPSNYNKRCSDCGGRYRCDGTCDDAEPRNYGDPCGCGGRIDCDGECSAPCSSDCPAGEKPCCGDCIRASGRCPEDCP